MLTFRNTNIFFVILVMALGGLSLRYSIPFYVWLILFLVYSGLLFYGSYYVGSNFFMKVLCSADTSSPRIAISFDDGPSEQHTPAILETLRQAKVPAAFFCIGKNIHQREKLLKQIVEEGHLIGNHSFSHHFWFDLFSTQKMNEDLQQMTQSVADVTGLKPLLFRPPYGVTTPNMRNVMDKAGFTAIGWNIRSLDTVIKEEDRLLARITEQLSPGAIVLLHDTSQVTAAVLPRFIQAARDKGYEFVRVDKLLNVSPYA